MWIELRPRCCRSRRSGSLGVVRSTPCVRFTQLSTEKYARICASCKSVSCLCSTPTSPLWLATLHTALHPTHRLSSTPACAKMVPHVYARRTSPAHRPPHSSSHLSALQVVIRRNFVVFFVKSMVTTILVVIGSLLTACFMHPEENIGDRFAVVRPAIELGTSARRDAALLTYRVRSSARVALHRLPHLDHQHADGLPALTPTLTLYPNARLCHPHLILITNMRTVRSAHATPRDAHLTWSPHPHQRVSCA
jgi:hypothetical protein